MIVLPPDVDDPDTDVIKTILAITNAPGRKAEPYHIVAELRDPDSLAVARIVGRDEAQLVLVGDLIARVIAQTCRQSGLSIVYTALLDFEGDVTTRILESSPNATAHRDATRTPRSSRDRRREPGPGHPAIRDVSAVAAAARLEAPIDVSSATRTRSRHGVARARAVSRTRCVAHGCRRCDRGGRR